MVPDLIVYLPSPHPPPTLLPQNRVSSRQSDRSRAWSRKFLGLTVDWPENEKVRLAEDLGGAVSALLPKVALKFQGVCLL